MVATIEIRRCIYCEKDIHNGDFSQILHLGKRYFFHIDCLQKYLNSRNNLKGGQDDDELYH